MIGAGSSARNFLLQTLSTSAELQSVVTSRPNNARYVADKFGFANCPSSADELLSDPDIDTIFIATRHDSHADYVLKALEKGKHVFVEKPLCLTLDQLDAIKQAKPENVYLMVGFNRRFSPMAKKVKSLFRDDRPKAINYRINAGYLPLDHWVHDPKVGGGRIIGEACHFIDLCLFLAGTPIRSINAQFMDDKKDTANILLSFENGSTANISYFSNGNKKLDKERLEVYCDGRSAVIDDFKTLTIFGDKIIKEKGKQDKGHAEQVRQFMKMIKNGGAALIDPNEIYDVSRRAIELAGVRN
jgi:polar amino acid transport system substrate-binding protein